MSTEQTVKEIKDFMAANPNAIRTEIAKGVGVSISTVIRCGNLGLVKLPKALSKSTSAKIGRIKREAEGKHFVINPNKKQVWQVGA